jgi:RHS repeat-associated protein
LRSPVKTLTYNPIGNILSKSDVGTYNYGAPGSSQPHAVMSISGSTLSTTFTYDPVGNQTAGLGRNVTWTSYNMPANITQGTNTISFLHDVDHQRIKQVSPSGNTLYISGFGVGTELFGAGTGAARWTDYLSIGNAKVGMRVINIAAATVSTRYFHTDHLGSVVVISDENGVVVERLSYDAWGKRRFPNGADDPTGSITSQTTRGFTGEEQLDTVALVHLNGRVYDPMVGRMISADPTVPDPMNAQAWNRYSYVGNDPLAFTDPSGFSWLSSFFNSVTNFFRSNSIARAILQIASTVILNVILPGSGVLLAVAAAAGGAAIATGLSGGNLGQILKASAIAGATAFAFNMVGDLTPGAANATENPAAYVENVASHALVGCASSTASGGSCQSGAMSGAVGSALSPITQSIFPDARNDIGQRIGGTFMEATAGGLASVAGGGKFANGAVTAAFGYLFNSQFHSHTAAGFVDDQGNAVLNSDGKPMLRPSDVDPHFFIDAGTAAGAAGSFSDFPGVDSRVGLANFGQGAAWDVQRVGSDRLPTRDFIDYATVGIGLYGAAAGIPANEILTYENTYAGWRSSFGGVTMDSTYTNLPARNVFNTNLGYQLYQSGRIR